MGVMEICPSVFTVGQFDAAKRLAFAEKKAGVLEYLAKYDKFLKGDRFTTSGTTFGEIDLFCKLNCYATGALPEVATGGLAAFYNRMMANEAVKKVLAGETKFGALSS